MCRFGTEEESSPLDRVAALVRDSWALIVDERGPRLQVVG